MTKSHGNHGKIVYRPYSSCISSIGNLTGTSLSSPCQLRLGVVLRHLSLSPYIIGMRMYFCNGPLVVMLILGWLWELVLKAASCISITFFEGSEGNASLIFSRFLTFCFVACANILVLLLCFDLAKAAALGLGGIGSGIFDTLPCTSF